jgi:predicted O-methyltransferase YrrM
VNPETWTAVDRYATDLLVRPADALVAALAANQAAGLPAIDVSAPQGKFLRLLAQTMGARRILEVGTLGGYSTLWFAGALPPRGRVVTLELDPHHANIAAANIARAGLADRVEIRVGPAADSLRQLIDESAELFDLAFLDADKASLADYYTLTRRLCRTGAVIIADNVVRKGAVLDAASTDEAVQGVRRFNDLVAADPGVDATILQTVGAKGYDGMTIVRVTDGPTANSPVLR